MAVPGKYALETIVTLSDIVDGLNKGGFSKLADEFAANGFHPDGIKLGPPHTSVEGRLYVSSLGTGAVLEIAADRTVRPYVNPRSGQSYGTAFDANGNLFVSYISRFTQDGGIDVVFAGTPTPADGRPCYSLPDAGISVNDLVLTKNGQTLYFSDDSGGRIFQCDVTLTDQNASCNCHPWLESPNTASVAGLFGGVDGLVLDEDEKNLYFNNFALGKLFKVAITADGSAGDESELPNEIMYGNADGMSLAVDGASIFTATFGDSGSAITETSLSSGETEIVIEDPQQTILNPSASLTVDRAHPDTLYLGTLDLNGMLLGYKNTGTDGGKVVRATRIGQPVRANGSRAAL